MPQYHFSLKATYRPETLERILRVVRHRGFNVCSLEAEVEQNILALSLSVESDRAFSLLTTQLEKLIDVVEITYNHEI